MAWLVTVFGAALALAGAVSLANGLPYIRLDWGQAETVAGTVAASGGLVTVALGAVLFALRDAARRLAPTVDARGSDRPATEASPPPRPLVGARSEPSLVPLPREEAFATAEPEEPIPEAPPHVRGAVEAAVPVDAPTVVGRYESNGASYVLFSDGTIEVETENGTHRFASMDALKDHIERQAPA